MRGVQLFPPKTALNSLQLSTRPIAQKHNTRGTSSCDQGNTVQLQWSRRATHSSYHQSLCDEDISSMLSVPLLPTHNGHSCSKKPSSQSTWCPQLRPPPFYSSLHPPCLRSTSTTISAIPSPSHHRPFSTTSSLRKKSGKTASNLTKRTAALSVSESVNNDPFDLTTLNASLASARTHLEEDLTRLKPGGRFNPSQIENIHVPLGKLKAAEGDRVGKLKPQERAGVKLKEYHARKKETQTASAQGETVRVADLAQVVPRGGRRIIMMLNDEKHSRPIISALLGSGLNLNPQISPENPLELIVPVPPPTGETRQKTVEEAGKAGERAAARIREARAEQVKVFRAMQLAGSVRSDDRFRAMKKMDEVVEGMGEEVKKRVEAARKVLGSVSEEKRRTEN